MRRTTTRQTALLRLVALLALAGATSSACGSGDESDGEGSGDPQVVRITFEDGEVEPNGDRVEVGAGEPIDLEVTADEPGTLHIHSDPEQEIAYETGTDTIEIQIDRPGVIEIESHELDVVIVQLEVR